jgi:prepilin-type N-terminal cleavage/methylation domain-containing protein
MPAVRYGFTLVELLVTLALLGVVSAAIYGTLLTHQRTYQAQTQRIGLQQNIRAALTVLPAEFRELDASAGDISAMARDSIRLRAMRTLAFLCATPVLGPGLIAGPTVVATTLVIPNQPSYGARDFDRGRDSLLVFYEGDEGTRSDDGWVLGRITGMAGGACPAGDRRPGREVAVQLRFAADQSNHPGAIPRGAPVRAFETVTYLGYRAADGRHYIGQRSPGDLQPIIGPVTADGLELRYLDSAGAATADPRRVAEIEIVVRGESAQPLRGAGKDGAVGYAADSVVTRVTLRNNRRF